MLYYKMQQRSQPFRAYRFLVEIEGNKSIVGAFTKFSGVKMQNEMAQFRSGDDIRGVKENIPGITEYQHVTLTKGVIDNNEFLDWVFTSTLPGAYTGPMGKSNYKNINIIALNDLGERGITWTLVRAIPTGYELEPMDANQSVVLSETLEFAIEGVVRTFSAGNTEFSF